MMLTASTPSLASRGLGQFEVLGPLLSLAGTGINAYLEKERQRRQKLEADRALRLAQQTAAADAARADAAAADAKALAEMGFAQQAAESTTTSYALFGVIGLGALWILTRK